MRRIDNKIKWLYLGRMAKNKKAELRINCDRDIKAKLLKIARKEERTLTGQVLYFLKKAIEEYHLNNGD